MISIVVPIFNSEKLILNFSKSLQNLFKKNNLKKYELIFFDDCSEDKSFDIAKRLAKKNKRIKIFKNQKNLGQLKSTFKGLRKVSGNFICIIDIDQIKNLRRMLQMLKIIRASKNIDVISSYSEFGPSKKPYELLVKLFFKVIDSLHDFNEIKNKRVSSLRILKKEALQKILLVNRKNLNLTYLIHDLNLRSKYYYIKLNHFYNKTSSYSIYKRLFVAYEILAYFISRKRK